MSKHFATNMQIDFKCYKLAMHANVKSSVKENKNIYIYWVDFKINRALFIYALWTVFFFGFMLNAQQYSITISSYPISMLCLGIWATYKNIFVRFDTKKHFIGLHFYCGGWICLANVGEVRYAQRGWIDFYGYFL